jgi:hypothetical protein
VVFVIVAIDLTPKFKAGFKSPVHIHTEDYFAVVVDGIGANHTPEDEAVPLPTGSYWSQRGEEAHVTQCLSDKDCLFFIVQPGKVDYVLETPNAEQEG